MKTATFEYGKQSLADWFEKNQDCEKMILKGKVYCDFWNDNFKEKVSEGVYQYRREINIGWDSYDLLFGFDRIAKDFHPLEFDVKDMHLLDWEGKIDDEEIPCDATEEQPSSILKMLVNKKYGTRFIYQNGILTSENGRVLIHYPNVKGTGTIPDTIDTIGRLAFAGIYEPEFSVVLPEGIVRIEEHAFDMSEGLVAINFPDSLHSIGESAFCGTNLIEVLLPNHLEEIPAMCFQWVPLENLHLPDNLKYVRNAAFVGFDIDEVRLPSGVEIVEPEAFGGTCNVIYIPKTIKELAEDFYYEKGINLYPEDLKPSIVMY
ncbi:MAG: leucine-rich repeat domain-containing protein [Bacteroidales bacterium]|nr:leucine-rich repeat domain-containing protein [Bacteroidales bacterium]